MRGDWVAWFDGDAPLDGSGLGGKCHTLATLARRGLPVPQGFALSSAMFADFLAANNLRERLGAACTIEDCTAASAAATALVESTSLPAALVATLLDAYAALGRRLGSNDPPVAVRSSATTEDTAAASAAGQQLTLLGIAGSQPLVAAVKRCWASLFSAHAIAYRRARLDDRDAVPAMAVGVQELVPAHIAGVTFTADPISGDPSRIVIEATWGLGETLVGGAVTPDRYVIDRSTRRTLAQQIGEKMVALDCGPAGTELREVSPALRALPCLTDDHRYMLVGMADAVEAALAPGQDIEWAIDIGGKCFLLQARPITVAAAPQSASPQPARPRSPLLANLYRDWV
jgi:pyruvate,water dikinase